MTRRRPSGPLLALGLWVLIDVLRVWTPSLITIFGRAAETPAELIGGFAIAVCATPMLVVALTRRYDGAPTVALALLVVARVGLQVTEGGKPQLWIGSLGVAAGIWWVAVEAGRRRADLAPGVALGVLLAATAQAALATYGAAWRQDGWGWLVLVVQVVAIGVAWSGLDRLDRRGLDRLDRPSRLDRSAVGRVSTGSTGEVGEVGKVGEVGEVGDVGKGDPSGEAPLGAALLVFPVLLLDGVLFADVGRASAQAGAAGAAICVAGAGIAVLALYEALSRRAVLGWSVVLVLATAIGLLGPLEGWPRGVAALPYLFGAPAGVVLLRAAERGGRRAGGPPAVAGGAVIWVVLLFAYYAGYDLGYRADLLIVLVAGAVGLVAVLATRTSDPAEARVWPGRRRVATVLVVPFVIALLGPALTLPRHARPAARSDGSLRVLAWNLRMGYGIDGRFDAAAVARTIRAQRPDVVLLSEIDRGWLLNGGQDQLRILARLTGMHASFGAAADPVWGDAILSRVPLRHVRSQHFASYGAVTGAEALSGELRWHGATYVVIATHLQPGAAGTDDTVGQARALAALARRASGRGRVIVGGDLNTEPGSAAWRAVLTSGLRDALASARPLLTSSSDHLTEQIDHVLASPGLTPSDPRALHNELSDHLPVVVDLRVGSVGG